MADHKSDGSLSAEERAAPADPYALDESSIREPPQTFGERLKYLGPGFILSASIVGSGELIATTIVGARAGFVLMWFIIFSCLVKVTVQLEYAKHTICSGESTMASLNSLPGPRFRNTNWTIWTWLLLMTAKMMQVGGIVGGVVLALEQFAPSLAEGWKHPALTYMVAASVSLLIFKGYYLVIEKASLAMIGGFTLFTLISICALQTTKYAITGGDIASGLIPSLPADTTILFVAMGAFGITGVGGDEILAYNYWLIEKGYASFTGPKQDTPEWEARAKGWIRVMHWDAVLSMLAYTAMTVMFYLLGAAVLNQMGIVPEDQKLIETLGNMYTESLGPWARSLFVIGAIVVLYSTLFGALAAWTRLFSDAFGRIGLINFHDLRTRRKSIAILAWVIPLIWGTLFLFINSPAFMVFLGGIATVVILLMVLFATMYFRYRRQDPRLKPSVFYDMALWLSVVSIVIVALLSAAKAVQKLTGGSGEKPAAEEKADASTVPKVFTALGASAHDWAVPAEASDGPVKHAVVSSRPLMRPAVGTFRPERDRCAVRVPAAVLVERIPDAFANTVGGCLPFSV